MHCSWGDGVSLGLGMGQRWFRDLRDFGDFRDARDFGGLRVLGI